MNRKAVLPWMLCLIVVVGAGACSGSDTAPVPDVAAEVSFADSGVDLGVPDQTVTCFGTSCKTVADCPGAGPCTASVSCQEGCCAVEFKEVAAPCNVGCQVDGQCNDSGECTDTKAQECPEVDGNPCTVAVCNEETAECAAAEAAVEDGTVPSSGHCWQGIVCTGGEVDDSQAVKTELHLECDQQNAQLEPLGCVDQIVCSDADGTCVEVLKDDGTQCWKEEGGLSDTCPGHACFAGECMVEHGFDAVCTANDFPDECGAGCQQCTTLYCHWIEDVEEPGKNTRYCKAAADVSAGCQDSNPCTEGDLCVMGSQTDGPLGKETLGNCQAGALKKKSDCAAELNLPALDCLLAGISCNPETAGCELDQDVADGWCSSSCPCCNGVNTFCDHKKPVADQFGCVTSYFPDGTPCSDANPCTKEDQCVLADEASGYKECTGTPLTAIDLEDGLACTEDWCDPALGVQHKFVEGCEEPCHIVDETVCEACGNCGERCKTCPEAGTDWEDIPWGECTAEGECEPGATDTAECGQCGEKERTCTGACQWDAWGECKNEKECLPGDLQHQECGVCKLQTSQCDDGCEWGDWSQCEDTGECTPGQLEYEECGNCGERLRTCEDICLWGAWGQCEDEGQCAVGAQEACGDKCGQRICTDQCQWGSCIDGGVCQPGTEEPCGNQCGVHVCLESCQWGDCIAGGPCSAGAVEPCGDCGQKTCSDECAWGLCQNEGGCTPGNEKECGDQCGVQVCTSQCVWGGCQSEGQCVPGNVQDCGLCGTQVCSGVCTWGTCVGQGICSAGSQQGCGMCGTQTCTAQCGWGGCAGEGVCTPGQTDFQNCPQGGVKERSCQFNCQWGSWSSCPYCGDGQCNGSENQSSCCQDCGCSGGKKCVGGNCCTDGDNDGYYTDCSPYDCSGKDNDKDIYPSASEKLDYKDNDCDGKIDETHRQTLWRRQGSNGFGYTNPGVDADHCWSDSQSGSSCMHNWNTGWAKYQYDGKQIQVYKLSIGSSTEKYVGNVLLARLAECYHPAAHEHQYWTTDSSQYQNLKNAGWQCGFVGYVRTGSLVGQDSKEISVRRHYHSVASDTMYSKEVNEGSGVGFSDKGTAWFAWDL